MVIEKLYEINETGHLIFTPIKGFFLRLTVGIIIFLLGLIIGKIIGKIVRKALREIELDKLIYNAFDIQLSAEEKISIFLSYLIYFLFFILALNQIGITTVLLQIFFVLLIIVIIVAVILSIKDFIPNAVAWLVLRSNNLFKKGDWIKVGDIEGIVTNFNLIETMIKQDNHEIVVVPNSLILKKTLTMHSNIKKLDK